MDLNNMIDYARETMQKCGHLPPMVYLEMTKVVKKKQGKRRVLRKNHLFVLLDKLSDTQSIPEQGGIMWRLGWDHVHKFPGYKPALIVMYAESWVPRSNLADKIFDPSTDPDRYEVVSIQVWEKGNPPKIQSYLLPVIRSIKDNSITRIEQAGKPRPNISVQLEGFVQGMIDALEPDDRVANLKVDEIRTKIREINPAQRQELIGYMRRSGIPQDFIDEIMTGV